MAESLVSGPILAPLAQIWTSKFIFVNVISTRCWTLLQAIIVFQGKLMNQTWENNKKPCFGPIVAHLAQIGTTKICVRHSLNIMVSYHHVQYQKKLMIQSWENLVTDGRTDGQARLIPQHAVRLASSFQQASY